MKLNVQIALMTTMLVLAGSVHASASLQVKDGFCRISEQVGLTLNQFQTDCARLEKAGLVAKSHDEYQLTALASTNGRIRWELFNATLPPPKPAEKPAYSIHAVILGHHQKLGMNANSDATISDDVAFMYMGYCLNKQDMAAMRNSVLASGNTDGVTAVEDTASIRPAHTPAKGESVTMNSGKWTYKLQLQSGEPDASGALPITLSGEVTGPTNYDKKAAMICNGLQPAFVKATIPATTIMVTKAGTNVDLPLLGEVSLHLVGQ